MSTPKRVESCKHCSGMLSVKNEGTAKWTGRCNKNCGMVVYGGNMSAVVDNWNDENMNDIPTDKWTSKNADIVVENKAGIPDTQVAIPSSESHIPKVQVTGVFDLDFHFSFSEQKDKELKPIPEPENAPVPDDPDFVLDPTQELAIDHACNTRFAIITGSAGTGKTTIIKQIADRLGGCTLAAFAGKAAARLKEATKRPASTIHRMLMFNGDRFLLESLKGRTVIIDEASMVAADLMAEVMRRNPSRLILVGDQAQLPPVGKGQPFHDLIELLPDKVVNLTKCFRNTEAVFKAAMEIRNGTLPGQSETSANEKWSILKSGPAENTHRAVLKMVQDGLIDFEQDIILCPKNGKAGVPCTVHGLNSDIVDIVNPRQGDEKFCPGDRVINTKNLAEKDVWNGTTGTIHSIDQRGAVTIRLDIPIIDWENSDDLKNPVYKDMVKLAKDEVKNLQLAYALTVHKSQGSQYRKVVFVALERDSFALLTRPLIYTAVTRTKQECIVAGQVQALWKGIGATTHKRTIIQELAR